VYPRWLRHLVFRPAVTPFPDRPDPGAPAQRPLVHRRHPLFARSLAIRHVDTGSCGAPESELALLASPAYDFARFGFRFTPSPRHADLLLVTGIVTQDMAPHLLSTYAAMPGPKLVMAVGDCAAGTCVMAKHGAGLCPLSQLVPVDATVPGCPPTPNDILAGLLAVVGRKVPGVEQP
jgi:membrane-bound hydrogenase subunit mbhJ